MTKLICTITNLGIPTVSPSGAKIGIASTAKPEDDGIMKPRKKKIINNITMKIGPLTPCTSDELKFKIVSEINPSFIIILIPRAKPMISDTPTKLDAPSTNASTPFRQVHLYLMLPSTLQL